MNQYLQWLTTQTKTAWWHDSANTEELDRALAHGATGVTTNPVLVAEALRGCGRQWSAELQEIFARKLPAEARALHLTGLVAGRAAARLPGYVCAQVNPGCVGDRSAMRAMADWLHGMAPNIAVKLPATQAGLEVAEDCIAAGMTITLTVSFTVAQVLAIAEAHRRGCVKARQAGRTPGRCFAVIMIGRIDDYLRDVAGDASSPVTEADIRQAGLAVVKRAVSLYRERGYEAVLCVAALRGTYHLTELAGADLIMSIHPKVQQMIQAASLPPATGIERAVPADVLERLAMLKDFRRAYAADGLTPDEFLTYGATQRTLAQFIETGWKQIESFQLPP